MSPEHVIEIIMAQHWDMVACNCWICTAGRENNIRAYEHNLPHRLLPKRYGFVRIDGEWMGKK
jgi:hypothetical protein